MRATQTMEARVPGSTLSRLAAFTRKIIPETCQQILNKSRKPLGGNLDAHWKATLMEILLLVT